MSKDDVARPRAAERRLSFVPLVLLTLAACFWGGNVIAGKLAVGKLEPLSLSTLRWSFATLLILPFALPALQADWQRIRGGIGWLALYGIVGFTAFNALLYSATLYTSGINVAMIQAIIPVFVMIGSFVLFRIGSSALHLLGVALAIYGVLHVASGGIPQRLMQLRLNIGDVMMVLGCLCYAAHSLCLRYRPRIAWQSFLLVTSLFAACSSLILQLLFGGGTGRLVSEVARLDTCGWAIVAYTTLFPSILAQLFYVTGVEAVGANRASLFINLVPVFGALFSVAILGERLAPYQLAAALFIVTGIALAEYSATRRK
ncbi:DMT family transporter [Aureimonas altamirensis]|uniref:DMT family transporter n=1 Tax=Aureimonas altamirensis TaxID=370622 RepID=UPI002036B257|nr:DMT family transporter [Aureimonas altamirensis]MCM2505023.1 DMT family transporter [Aureimonas altamirensis]